MRSKAKFLVVATLALLILALAGGVWYQRRIYQHSVEELKALHNELFALRPGETPYAEVRRIAERFGAIPYEPHYGGGHDCREGYFEDCVYLIALPRRVASSPRFIRKIARWGFVEWNTTAHIGIRDGKVQAYYFLLSFKNSDGKPRGVSVTQENSLTPRAVEARVSDSYAVSRNDIHDHYGTGFVIDANVTPGSTPEERGRAWHFELDCLSRLGGCQEICEVMPSAWKDFYLNRGKFDADRFGEPYRFCKDVNRFLNAAH